MKWTANRAGSAMNLVAIGTSHYRFRVLSTLTLNQLLAR